MLTLNGNIAYKYNKNILLKKIKYCRKQEFVNSVVTLIDSAKIFGVVTHHLVS